MRPKDPYETEDEYIYNVYVENEIIPVFREMDPEALDFDEEYRRASDLVYEREMEWENHGKAEWEKHSAQLERRAKRKPYWDKHLKLKLWWDEHLKYVV
ncbi:MAG: hypothetical protein GKS00_01980 [Alphaproteobacteria bacterium]|nr:hypothetical protein [Alphaproteobacteria bacterium]